MVPRLTGSGPKRAGPDQPGKLCDAKQVGLPCQGKLQMVNQALLEVGVPTYVPIESGLPLPHFLKIHRCGG